MTLIPGHWSVVSGHLELALCQPHASRQDVERLCRRAREMQVAAVCLGSRFVEMARACLEDSGVKVCVQVGGSLAAVSSDALRYEIEAAADEGAQEFEVCASLGFLKDGQDQRWLRELRDLVEAADERPVSVVLEPDLLSDEELQRVAAVIWESGAVAICAGHFAGLHPATGQDIQRLRATFGERIGLKAWLGDYDEARVSALRDAGAFRVGLREGQLRDPARAGSAESNPQLPALDVPRGGLNPG